jgi:hypothetical protein
MSRSKHGFIGGMLAASAAVGFLAAAPVAQAATDLVVWHAYRGDEKAAFEKVVGMYNAKQKDVAVKTLAVPYDAYADKITASVPRGRDRTSSSSRRTASAAGWRRARPSSPSTSSSTTRSPRSSSPG